MPRIHVVALIVLAVVLSGCRRSESTDTVVPATQAAPAVTPSPNVPAKAAANEADDIVMDQVGSASGLVFERSTVDLGKIGDESPSTAIFSFKNKSKDRTIRITETRVACECVVPKIDERTFAPGAEGRLEVSYSPQNRRGQDMKSVVVMTDDPSTPRIEIFVVCNVVPRIVVQPQAIFIGDQRFDHIAATRPTKTFSITAKAPGIGIKSVRCERPGVEIRETGVESVKYDGDDARKRTFEVTAVENLPIGRLQTRAVIETDDRTKPIIFVSIVIDAVGDLRAAPSPFFLQFAAEGETFSQEIAVSSRTDRNFTITDAKVIDCPNALLTVTVTPDIGKSAAAFQVKIGGVTPKGGTLVNGKISLSTDHPEQPTLMIPFSGQVSMAYDAAPQPKK